VGEIEHAGAAHEELHDVPAEIREVSFPAAIIGYNRGVVDAYVERVSRVIAHLESERSPRSAVRHALDRVGEQVGGILQQARESAEQMTTAAREEAADVTARAKAEAAEMLVTAGAAADRDRAEAKAVLARAREAAENVIAQAKDELSALERQAEARMAEIAADTEGLLRDRARLLDATRETAALLDAQAVQALERYPAPQPPALEAAVVAVNPGDVQAKRKARAASVTRLPAKRDDAP
jgi:cell division septum initiation protein DivIVA